MARLREAGVAAERLADCSAAPFAASPSCPDGLVVGYGSIATAELPIALDLLDRASRAGAGAVCGAGLPSSGTFRPGPSARRDDRLRRRWPYGGRMLVRRVAAVTAIAVCLTGGVTACGGSKPHAQVQPQPRAAATSAAPAESASGSPSGSASAATGTPPAAAAPAGLPTITYTRAASGFPADPGQTSTTPLTEALHPTVKLAAYDAPGGTARAYLTPQISGVQLIMPIVARQAGWAAVLLPTVNRSVGWLPDGGWDTVPLHDQLVVRRAAFTLTWVHDGVTQQTWTVTVGAAATPTPLGRTFVLGRSTQPSKVYAGLDVLALGAVPDNKGAVAQGLQDAHTGIHAWYRNEFGYRRSNGCVRMPPAAQQVLLGAVPSGTGVVVLP